MGLITKVSLVLVAAVHLSACGIVGLAGSVKHLADEAREKQKAQYLSSEESQGITIPSEINNKKISDQYIIPTVAGTPGTTTLPPGSILERTEISKQLPSGQPIDSALITLVADESQPRLLIDTSADEAFLAINSSLRALRMNVLDANRDEKSFHAIRKYGTTGRRVRDSVPHVIQLKETAEGPIEVVVYQREGVEASPAYAQRMLSSIADKIKRSS